ncbi:hypothetical protein D7V81_04815 [bacterium 1XD21-70]|nr:hypothetical protein D7V81_04815 [bacterium 1XD21-70]
MRTEKVFSASGNTFYAEKSGRPAPAKIMGQAFLQTILPGAAGRKPEGYGLEGFPCAISMPDILPGKSAAGKDFLQMAQIFAVVLQFFLTYFF